MALGSGDGECSLRWGVWFAMGSVVCDVPHPMKAADVQVWGAGGMGRTGGNENR